MKEILTVKEVAEYLRMNQMTIYKMAQKGEIPAFKIASNWRFRKEEIDEWLNQKAKCSNKLLIIDDEESLCKLLQSSLEAEGFDVDIAITAKDALKKVKKGDYDLVLLDLLIPEMNGVEIFKEINKFNEDLPVVMMTAYPDDGLVESAIREGIQFILRKPFDLAEVKRILKITLS
ncbi:MAG: response regulator [bacterium]